MTKQIAIYARYSSDLQNQASIEDQIRLCSERAKSQGWNISNCYTDAGISGASLIRPGIQALIQNAMAGQFDILLTEALDRLSRDQEDIAGLYKRMAFAGVKIVTLSEGEINTMHIGLKGTMNALFLQDLADKTRRGLRGRVEKGKSGGGLSYGYKVVKKFDANGEAIRGDREINQEQAEIIHRIFNEYAHHNRSPKAIAMQFNKEHIPSPSGGQWSQSAINGNRKRGTGILNNVLYIGQLVWNRQRFIKDPSTGRRVTRMNNEDEWVKQDVPELRIIPQELWDTVKARQKTLDRKTGCLSRKKRPQYLLSGLLECGSCGGGYSKINLERYGCSTARNKGESVCGNKTTIKRETLENAVLGALQTHLMRDDLLQIFCEEYTKHMNTLTHAQDATLRRYKQEQSKISKEREGVIQAIKDGIPAKMIKDDLFRITERQEELETLINNHEKDKQRPLLHPSMALRYKKEVQALRTSLNNEATKSEASEHIRMLVEKIVLTPKPNQDGLSIDLHGDLAGILRIATEDNTMKKGTNITKRLECLATNDNDALQSSVQLVAGARNPLVLLFSAIGLTEQKLAT